MPIDMPAPTAWYRKAVCIASRTASAGRSGLPSDVSLAAMGSHTERSRTVQPVRVRRVSQLGSERLAESSGWRNLRVEWVEQPE